MNLKATILLFHSTIIIHTVFGEEVPSPPRMVRQPPNGELFFQVTNDTMENDTRFVIECEAEGEPAPKYRWIKNGINFDWQVYSDRMSQQPGRGTLIVNVPKNEDEGQYQCFAENKWGVATSNSVFVRESKLGSFREYDTMVKEVREGEPFKLICHPPDGWPKPNVYWLLQDKNGQFANINNSRITLDPLGNLWFSNVTKADASEDLFYVCAATSVFRNQVKFGNKIYLQVHVPGYSGYNKVTPIQQYVTRRNEVALQNEKAHLYCIFGGSPMPRITWLKNGKPLKTTDRISFENYGKSLKIEPVKMEDEGYYTCEVTNGVGDPKSYTNSLRIFAKPYFTEEPKDVLATINKTVAFYCRASGNPEPQIVWTFNGKPIEDAAINPRRKISTNAVVIERLEKNDTGNYGCNATSSLGYVYKDVSLKVL